MSFNNNLYTNFRVVFFMSMNGNEVLVKAVLKAADFLEVSQDDLVTVLGVDLRLSCNSEIDPISESGQRALILIRIFKSLHALNGNDIRLIQHFMKNFNKGTGGIPAEQIKDSEGLIAVLTFLEILK